MYSTNNTESLLPLLNLNNMLDKHIIKQAWVISIELLTSKESIPYIKISPYNGISTHYYILMPVQISNRNILATMYRLDYLTIGIKSISQYCLRTHELYRDIVYFIQNEKK